MPEVNDTNKAEGWIRLLIKAGVIGALITAIGAIIVALISPHPTPTPTPTPTQADVIVCLRNTFYQPDPHVQGNDLVFQYQLLNRGSAPATVTSIHIRILGPNIKSGIIVPTNLDTLQMNLPVPGKVLTPPITTPIYVGPGSEERSFQSAESQVTWTNGHSQLLTHLNNGTGWTNDPACSSSS